MAYNNNTKSATGGNAQEAKIDFALGKIYKE